MPATFLARRQAAARWATTLRQSALAATLDQLAHAGLDDFYRGDVGREIAADLERIGSPVTRADLERYRAQRRRAAVGRDSRRHALQHAAADAGPRVADDPRAVRPARRRARPKASITSTALVEATKRALARARPHHHRSRRVCRSRSSAISTPHSSTREAGKIDRRKAARWPAAIRRRRHHLDGRGRRVRPRRLLHPVALLGIRLRLRAAADRRADAEPRHELFARPRRAQCAGAGTAAVPHAQSRARGAATTAASWPMARWAATASRKSRRRCSRAMCCTASRSQRRSTPALAVRPHLGLDAWPSADGEPLRRAA